MSDVAEAQGDEAEQQDPNNKAKPPLKKNLSPLVSRAGSNTPKTGTSGRGHARKPENQVSLISCLDDNIFKQLHLPLFFITVKLYLILLCYINSFSAY